MIISFRSKAAERVWNGEWVKQWPAHIQEIGRRKLRMLNNAQDLNDLQVPPSNRLEKLLGILRGYYSIRINDQWRIIFQWQDGNATNTDIVDYH